VGAGRESFSFSPALIPDLTSGLVPPPFSDLRRRRRRRGVVDVPSAAAESDASRAAFPSGLFAAAGVFAWLSVPAAAVLFRCPEDRERRRRRVPELLGAGPSPEGSASGLPPSAAGWVCSVFCSVFGVDRARPRPRLPRRRRGRGRASADPSAEGPKASSVMPRSFPLGEPEAPFRPSRGAARVAKGDGGHRGSRHVGRWTRVCAEDHARTRVRPRSRRRGREGGRGGVVLQHRPQDSRGSPLLPAAGYLNRRIWMFRSSPMAIQLVIIEVPP
jgi:hypothetical protein